MIGVVEAGGTHIRIARVTVGDAVEFHERDAFATEEPGPSVQKIRDFFANHPVQRLGLAWFGPIDLSTGVLTQTTPKEAWRGVDISMLLEVPTTIETDVNAAAVGEARWGAALGADPVVYITLGTGIGGGLVVHGQPVHGALHPEMGHIRSSVDDDFEGVCPFHQNCIEGLASGPAIFARTGQDPASLSDDHPVWSIVGAHLGELAAHVALIVSPQRIVVGGGVGRRPAVLDAARTRLREALGGYLAHVDADPARLLCAALRDDAALLGAAWLAHTDRG